MQLIICPIHVIGLHYFFVCFVGGFREVHSSTDWIAEIS